MNALSFAPAERKLLSDAAKPFPGQFYARKPTLACSLESIAARASTLTPLLEEMLRRTPPPPRWGLNE